MRDLSRLLLLVALALAVPVLPFVLAGGWVEAALGRGVRLADDSAALFAAVVAVLAVDVFLPVPSSGVGTLAGAELGTSLGTAATWLGLTVGAVVGFAVARCWGRPLAERLAGQEELARLDAPAERFGVWLVLASRPLPILAEATVLLLGASRFSWRAFLAAAGAANLVLAVAYAALGEVAREHGWLPQALVLALVAPLLVAWWLRKSGGFAQ